jgi:hypothetical protein
MKIFILDDPAEPAKYARFSHIGTWTPGSVCKKCGLGSSVLIEPLQIEWDPGTEMIGDFSWCGYTCIVTAAVRRFLEEAVFECRFGKVQVMPPMEKTKMPRVKYPYSGPPVSWLMPTTYVQLNESRSGIKLASDCPQCDQKDYTFKREGLVIDNKNWSGERIFRIKQFGKSDATFITEAGLDTLIKRGFTNICPSLAGSIEQ